MTKSEIAAKVPALCGELQLAADRLLLNARVDGSSLLADEDFARAVQTVTRLVVLAFGEPTPARTHGVKRLARSIKREIDHLEWALAVRELYDDVAKGKTADDWQGSILRLLNLHGDVLLLEEDFIARSIWNEHRTKMPALVKPSAFAAKLAIKLGAFECGRKKVDDAAKNFRAADEGWRSSDYPKSTLPMK